MKSQKRWKSLGPVTTLIGTLVLTHHAVAQTTRKVPADFSTIQQAIAAAVSGDTVLVSPGTYVENIDFLGKAIVLRSLRGPERTILDGNRADTVVTFQTNEGPASVLRGFTVRNGRASFGAGVAMSNAAPTIVGNIFDSNEQTAGGSGAAIDGNNSSARIEKNIFRYNTCDDQFSSGVVSFANTSSPKIINNIFVDNNCRAINFTLPAGNTPEISNNTIVGNRAGVRVDGRVDASTQLYRNNILVENGIGLFVEFGSANNNPTWKNNLVFNNSVNYQGIANQTALNGNLSAVPMFVDPANNNFQLLPTSPAIDAGSTTPPRLASTDFHGRPRVLDGNGDSVAVVDIGSHEFMYILCNGLVATITGTAGDNILTGTPGNDVIHGLSGNDMIDGLVGDDVICGGDGNDVLLGGLGNDKLFGNAGNDRLFGGAGNDRLSGDAGFDMLFGGDGNDRLFGGADDDHLYGGADDDVLSGGSENDICEGNAHNAGDTADVSCETILTVP